MRLRVLAVGGTIVLALSGCAGGQGHASPTTAPPAPTTTVVDPDVVPAVITVAYVNAVFKVLSHIYSEAARTIAAQDVVSAPAKAELRSIFNDPVYASQVQSAQLSITQGVIKNVRVGGGDAVTTVKRLIDASSSCVFIETVSNESALFVHPTPAAASEYFALSPKQAGDDPTHLNPSPWAISYNVVYLTPTIVSSRCPVA